MKPRPTRRGSVVYATSEHGRIRIFHARPTSAARRVRITWPTAAANCPLFPGDPLRQPEWVAPGGDPQRCGAAELSVTVYEMRLEIMTATVAATSPKSANNSARGERLWSAIATKCYAVDIGVQPTSQLRTRRCWQPAGGGRRSMLNPARLPRAGGGVSQGNCSRLGCSAVGLQSGKGSCGRLGWRHETLRVHWMRLCISIYIDRQ
jgi:hypothetical protein